MAHELKISDLLNNRCGYQSITQQYLKRFLIKDENSSHQSPNHTHTNPHQLLFFGFSPLHRTHNKSPPAVDIGYGQTVAGDPHRTTASRHTWAAHPRITHITDTPPPPVTPINSTNITDAEISPSWHTHTKPVKALPPYFRMKTRLWPHYAETCSLLHPLLYVFFRYCCVIDWYTHLLFIHTQRGWLVLESGLFFWPL